MSTSGSPVSASVTLPETEPPRAAGFTLTDTDLEPGINPYWLRAVQTDMEAAWSSPIFVDYAP